MSMSSRVLGPVCVLAAAASVISRPASAQAPPDSLRLLAPTNVRAYAKMNDDRRSFTNFVFWDELPKTTSTFVHPPNVTAWRGSALPASYPSSQYPYAGPIDRTVRFSCPLGGRVGVSPSVKIACNVQSGRENLIGEIDVGQGYVPGSPKACVFTGGVDFGFRLSFSEGRIDSQAVFELGLEDFEGYHIYRGIEVAEWDDPETPERERIKFISDYANIGEISREEAAIGMPLDSLYFAMIVPALRDTTEAGGVVWLPEPIPGIGSVIDIRDVHPKGRLGKNELFWVDRNAFTGFTYYYLVTTYDRGYNVSTSAQGLEKFDSCPVTQGSNPEERPPQCAWDGKVRISTKLEPQSVLRQIYAVPNPYRSGSSQFTAESYHNFPDNKIRFFNVPAWCVLKIFTVAGDLVWEKSQTDGPGTLEWDTRNLEEQEVVSGVYIYRVEAQSGDSMYGRIIVIR